MGRKRGKNEIYFPSFNKCKLDMYVIDKFGTSKVLVSFLKTTKQCKCIINFFCVHIKFPVRKSFQSLKYACVA